MIIRLKDILHGPRRFDFIYEPDWWRGGDADDQVLGLASPLKVQMTVSQEGNYYAVEGSLSGRLRVRCDRCLSSYSHVLQPEFRLFLSAHHPDLVQSEIELLEEDMLVEFITGEEIELGDIVREQIYLSFPMKFLCHEECRGLCLACGANLNRGECGCLEKKGHPAFLKLKELELNRVKSNNSSITPRQGMVMIQFRSEGEKELT